MSNSTLPNWNLRHQRQEEAQENTSSIVPMSTNEVMEITWEKGLPSMQGLIGIHNFPTASTKPSPTWENKAYDTLESIVHQATSNHHKIIKSSSAIGKKDPSRRSSSDVETAAVAAAAGGMLMKKRLRSEPDQCGRYFCNSNNNNNNNNNEARGEGSPRAASASRSMFSRDRADTTMASAWPSSESLRSVKTKTLTDDDSACHDGSENENEENQTRGETVGSLLTRNSRAAAIHNQSERRRRDKINQKMKALQKLVPNASKTDKASMLDEVIEYLKQLQAQVQMMSVRSMSQMMMMMPLGMQQQLQMSLLARMGMGVGLGVGMGAMFDVNNIARTATHQPFPSLIHPGVMSGATSTLIPPPFAGPPGIQPRPASQSNMDATTKYPVPYTYPYNAFLTHQSMNMDLYNKMTALFLQQAKECLQQTSDTSSQAAREKNDGGFR